MLPQIRQQPWYPGQFGVPGADVPRGLRWSPTSIVLYVDPQNNMASDDADGTDPENPLLTVQQAVNRLIAFEIALSENLDGSVIVVAAQSTINEDVLVGVDAPEWCTIMGAGNGTYNPVWNGSAAGTPNLHIRQQGWRVTGFRFRPPATSSAVRLDWRFGSTDNGNFCMIDNNQFFGEWRGLYGVELYGAPFNTQILNNQFHEIGSYGAGGGAWAICVTDTGQANPLTDKIIGNHFFENDNHVGSVASDRAWNMSLFQGNVFQDGIMNPATLILDLRGGSRGYNIVTGNFFDGVYSNAGGYHANAATPNVNWVGNIAEPTPVTVADNGITVQVPA